MYLILIHISLFKIALSWRGNASKNISKKSEYTHTNPIVRMLCYSPTRSPACVVNSGVAELQTVKFSIYNGTHIYCLSQDTYLLISMLVWPFGKSMHCVCDNYCLSLSRHKIVYFQVYIDLFKRHVIRFHTTDELSVIGTLFSIFLWLIVHTGCKYPNSETLTLIVYEIKQSHTRYF